MPIALPPVSLSSLSLGGTGILDFSSVGPSADPSLWGQPASLALFNDSGCGLNLVFLPSGSGEWLPAGAWRTYTLVPGDSLVQYTVGYLLVSAPISVLMAVYYAPWEQINSLGVLGNSPIGISGVVNTAGGGGGTQTVQEAVKSGTVSTGSLLGFVHGLSVTPDFSFASVSGTGHRNIAVTNYTTTTVDIYAPVATVNFLLYSIKIN